MPSTGLHFPIKRIYEPVGNGDGTRVLVDRLWPRGVSKAEAHIALWLKDVAPTPLLRKWFGHDPVRWVDFRRRYRDELERNAAAVAQLRDLAAAGPLTLIYAAHDPVHNHARVLAEYLEADTEAGHAKPSK
ncbi:MAG TPA: DUF488 domain-containing protein [Devosia sp.]|jgi:uncharacterized protein YeaO (DUF488 family)|uniref:DUF488 domain-containing protein n=1 Tax=Devosia sp. TaxID=1871048 RepID=UPI002DDDB323|nr:DUF488 domain-containing protein [Devosia sp.]HEV2515817.1 DUF488 domain-containing protein [Devosia sp.]